MDATDQSQIDNLKNRSAWSRSDRDLVIEPHTEAELRILSWFKTTVPDMALPDHALLDPLQTLADFGTVLIREVGTVRALFGLPQRMIGEQLSAMVHTQSRSIPDSIQVLAALYAPAVSKSRGFEAARLFLIEDQNRDTQVPEKNASASPRNGAGA